MQSFTKIGFPEAEIWFVYKKVELMESVSSVCSTPQLHRRDKSLQHAICFQQLKRVDDLSHFVTLQLLML